MNRMRLKSRASLTFVFVICFALPGWSAVQLADPADKTEKKTTKECKLVGPLADLACAVPQDRTQVVAGQKISKEQLAPPAGFSIQKLPKSVRDAVDAGTMRINDKGEVQVYIVVTDVSKQVLNELQTNGATIELTDNRRKIVQARVPVTRLSAIAELPSVCSVRLPNYGMSNIGSITTEGDSLLKADQVRALFGVNGTGIRVGVISGGIAGVFASGCTSCSGLSGGPISTGDLPPVIGTRDASGRLISLSGGIIAQSFCGNGNLEGCPTNAEGTAMLEIIYDLAPGVQLLFANFDTDLAFENAVNFLAANADVVVTDISFFGKPYDGTSNVSTNTASALNDNINPIRAFFNSTGNRARDHYRGDYVDSGVDGTTLVGVAGNFHLFRATADTSDVLGLGARTFDPIFLKGGATAAIFLVWNDPFSASTNDFGLYLVQDSTGRLVKTGLRLGPNEPNRALEYTNDTGADRYFDIRIQNLGNKAVVRNLNMFIRPVTGPTWLAPTQETHNYNTVKSSVPAQDDAGGSPVSVISVAAANWKTSDAIELFSSNGPTLDGRIKPDVTATDGVSITGAGGFGNSPPGTFPQTFFGTSAAAPHAAGVAALLLQLAPCLKSGAAGARTPVDARTLLRKLILDNAFQLGDPGMNNVFGAGRIDALASANQTIPTANAGPDRTVAGNNPAGADLVLDGSGSRDPDACPLTFAWSGDCGPASGINPTLRCPFGTSNMSLAVTNNGITVPNPSKIQVTVTDFNVAVSPASATVSRGQNASYTVALTPRIGSFNAPIALSCSGLPASSFCSFSPPTITPGAAQVTSTLTISTSAGTAFLKRPLSRQTFPAYAFWLPFPAGIALLGFGSECRRLRSRIVMRLIVGTLLLTITALHIGCGGGGSNFRPPSPTPTPTSNSVINVIGTSAGLQHSTTVTLNVQ